MALLLGATLPASAATYPAGFSEQVMVSGLTRPTQVAWAPDGRMFIIQKDGLLLVLNRGASRPEVVADYSGRVNGQRDRGLLGLAVDGQFASHPYLYLLFTYEIGATPETEGPMVSQLMKVRVDPANNVGAPEAILGTETSGLCPAPDNTSDCMPSEGYTHSIGSVRGASDGTLWVSNGDGVSPGDGLPLRTYDPESMAGKILHIDRDGNGVPGHPFCQADDNLDHVCTKVFASGFRNPFRFSLRPGGGLAVGDVGWEHREEIDLIAAGGRSYGWPCFEGGIRTPGYQTEPECTTEYARPPGTHTSPTYDYPHAGSNAVVTGPTYAGARYPPQYRGSLFFGDFTGGFIRRLLPNGSGGLGVKPFAEGWRGVALESAPGGDLVTVSPGGFQAGEGRVSRIVYTPPPSVAPSPPAAPAPILPADTAGPRLRLTKIRLRRGRISGTVSDPSGVRSVKVAVRRRLPRGGCAWWLRPRRRLSHGRKSCDRPRWMRARLRRREGRVLWSVRLGGRLPAGVFRVLVRAVDNNGNASRLPRGAATVVRVKRRP